VLTTALDGTDHHPSSFNAIQHDCIHGLLIMVLSGQTHIGALPADMLMKKVYVIDSDISFCF
jgi:hypothetical protein